MMLLLLLIMIMMMIIINLIHIAQFDTNGILTALHIVISTYQHNICTYVHTIII